MKIDGKEENVDRLRIDSKPPKEGLDKLKNNFGNNNIKTEVALNEGIVSARYIVFLKPDSSFNGKDFPAFVLTVDGKKLNPLFNGKTEAGQLILTKLAAPGNIIFN